jgi:hypothetical protein
MPFFSIDISPLRGDVIPLMLMADPKPLAWAVSQKKANTLKPKPDLLWYLKAPSGGK